MGMPRMSSRAPLFSLLVSIAVFTLGCSSESETSPPPDPPPFEFYFCSNRTGNFEIYLSTDGVAQQITDDPLVDSWWPRASPDSGTLLFYRSDVADRPPSGSGNNNYAFASLWMLDLSTGQLTERIAEGANGWSTQGVADWSPDGTQLVMAAQSTLDGDRWHLFVTDALGANPTRVSTRTSFYLDPSWSPDGTRIVCAAFPAGYNGVDVANLEIHVLDADGSNEVRLTNDAFRDHDPYFSPDSLEIAFETDIDPTFNGVGRWGLRGVTADGAMVRTILEDGQINTLPQWSHDGSVLYFHRLVFGAPEAFRIAKVNRDGSGLAYLTPGGSYDDSDFAHTNFMNLRSGGVATEEDWFHFEFPAVEPGRDLYPEPGYFVNEPTGRVFGR
ncbi:translocation protein TolB [Planctomycetes bacterium Poly30]|uniref:Translocation protein TolB n=1 Tax=Saltatorellus ferox TaxID=2528018 RepID=A0A518EUU8_9BACT|nr:translocation protein TolB [Planctomycetes bacterium Poly30]